jgi:hypothetical protein
MIAVALIVVGGPARTFGFVLLAAYAVALTLTGAFAALRLRSTSVGLLAPLVVVLTQGAYVVGFARGLVGSRSAGRATPRDTAATRNLEA